MKKILVVDDDASLRLLLCQLFTMLGYTAVGEGNALAVVHTVIREKPDLVTLDMRMPGASGIDVLRAMHQSNLRVPVVVISGALDSAAREEFKRLGITHILLKPVRLFDLQATLAAVFRGEQSLVPA